MFSPYKTSCFSYCNLQAKIPAMSPELIAHLIILMHEMFKILFVDREESVNQKALPRILAAC